jgi:hypothetical protein
MSWVLLTFRFILLVFAPRECTARDEKVCVWLAMTKRTRSETTSTEGSDEDKPASYKRTDTQQDDVEGGSALKVQTGLDHGEPPLLRSRREVAKPSGITGDAVTSIKIFNMNLNGLMKAFSRKNKRLEILLKEQGEPRHCSGHISAEVENCS